MFFFSEFELNVGFLISRILLFLGQNENVGIFCFLIWHEGSDFPVILMLKMETTHFDLDSGSLFLVAKYLKMEICFV